MGSAYTDQEPSDQPPRGGRRWIVVSALFVAFALTAWIGVLTTPYRHSADSPQGRACPVRRAHVVIFLIDTLRADRLGVYGDVRGASPHIDALARESVVFTSCYAAAPWTLPSVVSLQTSTFPCEHGVLIDGQQIAAASLPLAQRLNDAGYATASFYANPYAGPMTGLDRGFDHVAHHPATDGSIVDAWLGTIAAEPFFAYIHNIEPHDPFMAPQHLVDQFGHVSEAEKQIIGERLLHYRRLTRVDFAAGRPVGTTDNTEAQQEAMRAVAEYADQIETLYAAAVRDADAKVGSVIDALKRRGVWGDTLFIVTSDHGEELRDHGGWQHDQSVYEELVHVPLIVRFPDPSIAPCRIGQAVSLVDLIPTILDFLGRRERAGDCRGRSLMPLIEEPASVTGGSISIPSMRINRKKYFKPYKESRGDVNVVLRSGDWKGIFNVELDTFELYDLGVDPAEQQDVAAAHAELIGQLRDRARRWLDECLSARSTGTEQAPRDLDEAIRERLRSLGYVE